MLYSFSRSKQKLSPRAGDSSRARLVDDKARGESGGIGSVASGSEARRPYSNQRSWHEVPKGEWLRSAKCREMFPLSRLKPTAPPQAVAPFGAVQTRRTVPYPSRSDRFNGVTGVARGPKGRNRNLPWPLGKKSIKQLTSLRLFQPLSHGLRRASSPAGEPFGIVQSPPKSCPRLRGKWHEVPKGVRLGGAFWRCATTLPPHPIIRRLIPF